MKLAHLAYRLTPFRAVRQTLFDSYARLVRNRLVVADIDGVRYQLDLGELIDLAVYLRKFEPAVVAAIHQECRVGMRVLDIGANIGAHAMLLGSLVGESGHVFAFEPTQFAFSKLERNAGLNPRLPVSVFRVALAEQAETCRRISFRASWRTDGTHRDASCEVEFIRLDDWAAMNAITTIELIKIDVDGNEYSVLAGGIGLLKRCRPILLMELVGPHFADPARNPFALLASLGYSFASIDTGRAYSGVEEMSRLIPANDAQMTTSINIRAVPQGGKPVLAEHSAGT